MKIKYLTKLGKTPPSDIEPEDAKNTKSIFMVSKFWQESLEKASNPEEMKQYIKELSKPDFCEIQKTQNQLKKDFLLEKQQELV